MRENSFFFAYWLLLKNKMKKNKLSKKILFYLFMYLLNDTRIGSATYIRTLKIYLDETDYIN